MNRRHMIYSLPILVALMVFSSPALRSAADQTYEDMTEFLLAFSKGFASKPKTLSIANIGNPTFEIYVFMLMYWRIVGALKSVRELHDVLVKVFGAHRIGELKRIEKICLLKNDLEKLSCIPFVIDRPSL